MDSLCHLCGGQHETTLHCLMDCPLARRMWGVLGFMMQQDFCMLDTRQWLAKFWVFASSLCGFGRRSVYPF